MRLGFYAATTLALGLAHASAQTRPAADPSAWLAQVYDLYRRAEKNPALEPQARVTVVEKRASRALAALFKRDHDCETKSHEICALDWDYVVNGQDVKLSDVHVGPTVAAGDKASVTVAFRNFGSPNVNLYRFVREDGAWKVDEIESRRGKEKPTRIGELLRQFKSY